MRDHRANHYYVGFVDARHSERHLSLVPMVSGLDAVCGAPLASTTPSMPGADVVGTTTCPRCRVRVAQRPIA